MKFIISRLSVVKNGTRLRFTLTTEYPLGARVLRESRNGCLAGVREDGGLWVMPPSTNYRPITWSQDMQDEVIAILNSRGLLKGLDKLWKEQHIFGDTELTWEAQ